MQGGDQRFIEEGGVAGELAGGVGDGEPGGGELVGQAEGGVSAGSGKDRGRPDQVPGVC